MGTNSIDIQRPVAAYMTMETAAEALHASGLLSSVTNRVTLGKLLSNIQDVRIGNMRLISITHFLEAHNAAASVLPESIGRVQDQTDRPAVVWI